MTTKIKQIQFLNQWPDFYIDTDEFQTIKHPEYNNLDIKDGLAFQERLSSILKRIVHTYDHNISMSCYNITHGGFIFMPIITRLKRIDLINCSDTSIDCFKRNFVNFQALQYLKHTIVNNVAEYDFYTDILIYNHIEGRKIYTDKVEEYDFYIFNHINNMTFQPKNGRIFKIKDIQMYIYVSNKYIGVFINEFKYYFEADNSDILVYNNLIHLCMIVKDAGDGFEDVLIQNLPYIDKYTILDTGSSDNTVNIIKKIFEGKKEGTIHHDHFKNFRDTRNKCLELAGTDCKFILMLDDTYIIKNKLREFLELVRADIFASSYSLTIQSNDVCYASNRIIKSEFTYLRYIYTIHEVITPINNTNVIIPFEVSHIFDVRSDYMEKRTLYRKYQDIQMLEKEAEIDPENPRTYYYLAQTYNLLQQYEKAYFYYIKRFEYPQSGFLQEKIDAGFEAARMANFYLNKPWEICEDLYNRVFDLDKSRGDPLYFIGIHYYLEAEKGIDTIHNYEIAFNYMKQCFYLGYPEHCQYSLKPTLHYYYLPKFLCMLSYLCNDIQLGKQSADRFLSRYNDPQFKVCVELNDVETVKAWNDIFTVLLYSIQNTIPKTITTPIKPLLVFMQDGGFEKWAGCSIENKGIGGSETFIIEISKYIQKNCVFDVYVFCNCDNLEGIYNGVRYIQLNKYYEFIQNTQIHTCIIGRYSEYLPASYLGHIQNIYLLAHDLTFTGNVIPIHTKFKGIIALTNFHKQYLQSIFPTLSNYIKVFGYGINQFDIPQNLNTRKSLVFIYSSYAIRGLLPLLQMWPKIVNRYPNASLIIHTDINNKWCNNVRPDEMNQIRLLINSMHNDARLKYSLQYKGWTNKYDLYKSWVIADIWFYPCTYIETFCHSALEAAMSKTLSISSDLGGLKDTVADRGLLLNGDFNDKQFQNSSLIEIFKLIEDTTRRQYLIELNYEWALKQSWTNKAFKFQENCIYNNFE